MMTRNPADSSRISEKDFSEEDLIIHSNTIRRRWWNLLLTFVVLWGIYGFALMVDEVRAHYQLVMMPFLIPSVFFLGLVIPGFVRLYKDGKRRIKYCGTFQVETAAYQGNKSTTYYLFVFVDGTKRKIRIKEAELDQVQSGVPAYVELSAHASTIFRFNQNGREVVFKQM